MMISRAKVAITDAAPDRRISGKPAVAATNAARLAPISRAMTKGSCTWASTGYRSRNAIALAWADMENKAAP